MYIDACQSHCPLLGNSVLKAEVSTARSTLNEGVVTDQANYSQLKFCRILIIHVID